MKKLDIAQVRKRLLEHSGIADRWKVVVPSEYVEHESFTSYAKRKTKTEQGRFFVTKGLIYVFLKLFMSKRIQAFALLPGASPRLSIDLSSRQSFAKGLWFYKFGSRKGQVFQKVIAALSTLNLHFLLLRRVAIIVHPHSSQDRITPNLQGLVPDSVKLNPPLYLTAYLGKPSPSSAITILGYAPEIGFQSVFKVYDQRYYDFSTGLHKTDIRKMRSIENLPISFIRPKLIDESEGDGFVSFSMDYLTYERDVDIKKDIEVLVDALCQIALLRYDEVPFSDCRLAPFQNQLSALDWNALPYLSGVYDQFCSGLCSVSVGFCHGDFAEWNLSIQADQLQVFDWEESRWDTPILNDLCRLIFARAIFPYQPNILSKRFELLDFYFSKIKLRLPFTVNIDIQFLLWVLSLDVEAEIRYTLLVLYDQYRSKA